MSKLGGCDFRLGGVDMVTILSLRKRDARSLIYVADNSTFGILELSSSNTYF